MNIKIGIKIKELRKRDNVTQERFAEAIGVTSQAISKWESENGYPDIEYITPIADFFNVSIDYLFDHDTDEKRKKMDEYRGIVKKIQSIQNTSNHLMDLINDILNIPKTNVPEQANHVFIANMGEIKKPINFINEIASGSADTIDIEKKDQAIHQIKEAANHLLGVVNDIMDMAAIQTNKLILTHIKIFPEKIIRRIIDIVSIRANEKRQKLTYHVASDIPPILMGDEGLSATPVLELIPNNNVIYLTFLERRNAAPGLDCL